MKSRFALCLFAVLLAACGGFPLRAAAKDKPNIVIILADDMGYGDVSCFGQTKYQTPNIDRIAAEGAKLTDFYCPFPYCAPTRASLLTGRYPFRSGMTKNPAPDENKENDKRGLPNDELTLGQVFQKAGYRTAAIGKWHLGHQPEFNPTRRGFNEYLGVLYSHDMRPVQVMDGTKVVEYPVVLANLMKKYTTRATQFMERNKGTNFFLYFASPLPHKPLFASEDFYKKSGAGLYGDAMLELDRSVGELLKKISDLGLEKETLVFFTSDNGAYFGGSNGGLRGMKGSTWDGGLRVPFMARWPGKIPAGHVSPQPAIMMDIFATSLFACGLEVPQDRFIDGKNLLPILTGEGSAPHEAIFGFGGDKLQSVRSGKWKLHVLPPKAPRIMKPEEKWIDKRAPDGVTILAPFEQAHPSEYPGVLTGDETKAGSLFDLETDPGEQHDIAAQHPDIVRKLQNYADEMQKQMDDAMEKRTDAGK